MMSMAQCALWWDTASERMRTAKFERRTSQRLRNLANEVIPENAIFMDWDRFTPREQKALCEFIR